MSADKNTAALGFEQKISHKELYKRRSDDEVNLFTNVEMLSIGDEKRCEHYRNQLLTFE